MPGEKERRRGSVAPLTTGRREEEAVLSFYKSKKKKKKSRCFSQLLALPIEGGCVARKHHSHHFLVAFNEGREHK